MIALLRGIVMFEGCKVFVVQAILMVYDITYYAICTS